MPEVEDAVKQVYLLLRSEGLPVTPVHAGRSKRETALGCFTGSSLPYTGGGASTADQRQSRGRRRTGTKAL